ncbi:MAG: endonuclease/exonuclease/phosphatase family protein [Armatimonadota bacterium]|nr:endonuclease/exonuclease/phosphatase family protein [Armatimonadota bacterium]
MGRGLRAFAALCVLAVLAAIAIQRFLARDAGETAPPATGTFRIATWNLGWLLEATKPDRLKNMRRVVESLGPHILAAQEVESKVALTGILPPGYTIAMADDPEEDQELAVAFKAPFKLAGKPRILFTKPSQDSAFPGRRNVLEVGLRSPSGEVVQVIVVHYKSRGGGRTESDPSRIEASRLLLDYLQGRRYKSAILLGDFNDTPDDASINILESGNHLGGEINDDPGKYFVNLMQSFYDDDYVTQGFFRRFRGMAIEPVVRGASKDNNRLRGQYYQFPRDVKVTQALFDQILVSPPLYRQFHNAAIYCHDNALAGRESQVTRNKQGLAIIKLHGTLPSDHLPVYADFRYGSIEPTDVPKDN